MNIKEIEQLSNRIRQQIISMADYCHGDAHWGGALSCTDMLSVLYGDYLKSDISIPYENRDKFLLSKGQSGVALYATLAECGIIETDYLTNFQQNGSLLGELAIMDNEHGIEISGGSLGLGLPMGVGLAISAQRKKYEYRTVVMTGDGECNEGSVWEAIMLAGQLMLSSLTLIIDMNGLQSDGNTDDIINNNMMADRLKAFGWNTYNIDGHNYQECLDALCEESNKPKAILMKTIKGKGISFMENDNSWHHKILEHENLYQARKEVGL